MVKLHSDKERTEKLPTSYENLEKSIIVRNTGFSDIEQLVGIYLNLSHQDRRWFHPFPFNRLALRIIFYAMVCLGKVIPLTKVLYSKLVSLVLVAEDSSSGKIVGFTYLRVKSREKNGLVANRGIISVSGTRSKGIGARMDSKLISVAKGIGIRKFRVTVLKDNAASISFHERMGYTYAGFSTDFYNGSEEGVVQFEYIVY
jgi:RimJ/RimL family protein N-acetyltransferase